MTGADQRERKIGFDDALDQRFDASAGRLRSQQPCTQHARVIEHQQVTWHQQLLDVAEYQIVQPVGCNVQQPTRGALGQWLLRDQLSRELVIKLVEGELLCDLHGFTGQTQ